ncbi:MAG: TonB-dependent receptor [Ignavibacteriaceae bacterium]|jgi:TonB-dependent receptor|nr:TonB-dependent receptor [Ignavibacteriaceae bacterium]
MKLRMLLNTLLLFITCTSINLAQSGEVTGKITDGADGSPLWGTNIMVAGTSIGTTTDMEGKYRLSRVPAGNQVIVFKYLGYRTDSIKVVILLGKTTRVDTKLDLEAVAGQEVIVTAQLQGQAAAINQQLSSNKIVNVVSKDRIEELPDQNAAESVGRLPGISIQRDAGEGTKLVVRGLSPKFNSVTVNGQRIPATDAQNRSVDLSMLSSDMLAGIEVFKALTPDLDADAVGGTVNFQVKKADTGLNSSLKLQGGYINQDKAYDNYRGNFAVSNRFLENKLGVLLTGNIQRANRGSDILDASYLFDSENKNASASKIIVGNLNLGDRREIRDRFGASLVMDYELENGEIMLSSLYGRTDRDEVRRRKRYRVDAAYVEYWLRNREINIDMFTNSLSGKHNFGWFNLSWQGSYSYSGSDMPFSHDSQFREIGAFNADLVANKGPKLIPLGAKNNLEETIFKQDFIDSETSKDKDFTGQFDIKMPFSLFADITGEIKFGGKIRDKNRTLDKGQFMTLAFTIDNIGKANPGDFATTREGKIKINNFYDESYTIDDFLNGQYEFGPAKPLDRDKLEAFKNKYWSSYVNNHAFDLEDYEAGESVYAGYLMSEINVGPDLMILPGFRVERTVTSYKSKFGQAKVDEDGIVQLTNSKDTVGTVGYNEFLPMIHIKYNFTRWMDLRLAFTKTLSRPDYFNLVPWERVLSFEGTIERGEPYLKHTKVWNYDAYLTFYGNFGLVGIGGYYKKLRDIDYLRTSRITTPGPTVGYTLVSPENSKYDTEVKGLEIEVQTNLRFLPEPFDGIVLYANYSYIDSKTFFPYLVAGKRNPRPPFNFTFIDSVREARMPGQAEHIANFTFGYEKGDFSGRVSLIYQGSALQIIGQRAELDGYSDAFVRWDFAAQYKIIKNLALQFNLNNFTNLPEGSYLGLESYPTKEEYFGWTADLGIKYEF